MERTGPGLILFDVDHTLLDVSALHEPAYEAAVLTAHGIPVRLRDIVFVGKTTPNIFRDLCAHAGLERAVVEASLPGLLEQFIRAVIDALPSDLRPNVLPGIPALLECLEQRGHPLGVVSGNPPEIGHEVLGRAGLSRRFSVFAFGPEAAERWQLVQLAIERASSAAGRAIPAERVVVVGDTPFDAQAGRRAGARTVLVGTSIYPRSELEAAQPDLLVPSFAHAQSACRALSELAGAQ